MCAVRSYLWSESEFEGPDFAYTTARGREPDHGIRPVPSSSSFLPITRC